MQISNTHLGRTLRTAAGVLALSLVLWTSLPISTTFAAPQVQTTAIRAAVVHGKINEQSGKHYLGLEPLVRNGIVVLTLAYDPQDDPKLRGLVNFLVLDEDGLRRSLAGGNINDFDIASGAPMQFDQAGNKMRATFTTSGRGSYTVVVYNNSTTPISYSLSAIGSLLLDDAGQVELPATATPSPPAIQTEATTQPSAPATVETSSTAINPASATAISPSASAPAFSPIRARRISGTLANRFSKHYFTLNPNVRDGEIGLNFTYDPRDVPEVRGKVNFWVLDEDGVRRMVRGDAPASLQLATGLPVPFSANPQQLGARFKASGDGVYTIVVFNESTVLATYVLEVADGVAIDLYGQSNESRAAAVEQAALNAAAGAATPTPAPPEPMPESAATADTDLTVGLTQVGVAQVGAAEVGAPVFTGQLTTAYQHHYYGLNPTIANGTVIITLDFDPKDQQALRENINFWVLNEDGLRRVVSGARPEDVDIAVGSVVQYGPERGMLRAVFNTSGRGQYTVIVFNNSEVPAQYSLRARGALLENSERSAGFVESLP